HEAQNRDQPMSGGRPAGARHDQAQFGGERLVWGDRVGDFEADRQGSNGGGGTGKRGPRQLTAQRCQTAGCLGWKAGCNPSTAAEAAYGASGIVAEAGGGTQSSAGGGDEGSRAGADAVVQDTGGGSVLGAGVVGGDRA